jgi:glyoxylase-like metal-dependent hydrolase (beta-lactamase superfamily II)
MRSPDRSRRRPLRAPPTDPGRSGSRPPSPDVPYAIRVLAPNPGPFTLEGTNTWVVGFGPSLVIDPGPDDPKHVDEILRQAGGVRTILLTHRHPDHAPGAARLAALSGAPVMAFRPDPGELPLRDGQRVEGGGVSVTVVHTPGHTGDHVVFHDADFGAMFTGDAVLGRGTSVVDPPEGEMAAYVRSLERMVELSPRLLYPGHGPAVWRGQAKLLEYLDHRRMRERQILDGLSGGARTPEDLVSSIYSDHPPDLHPGAARSVLAHLLKLEEDGRVVRGPAGSGGFRLAQPSKKPHPAATSRRASSEGKT